MIKTIAIDFDGVIHKYSKGWHDGTIYDEPVEGVFKLIGGLCEDYNVFIFSTRSPRQIKKWLHWHCFDGVDPEILMSFSWQYGFSVEIIPFWKKFWDKRKVVGITKRKLPAHVYIDDRAIRHENWRKTLKLLKQIEPPNHSL